MTPTIKAQGAIRNVDADEWLEFGILCKRKGISQAEGFSALWRVTLAAMTFRDVIGSDTPDHPLDLGAAAYTLVEAIEDARL